MLFTRWREPKVEMLPRCDEPQVEMRLGDLGIGFERFLSKIGRFSMLDTGFRIIEI